MLKRLLCLVVFAAICGSSHAAPEDDQEQVQSLEPGQLYRYRDDEGSTVMDYSLPPGVAEKGYEILSPTGRVVKTVPSAAELKEQAREEKEKEPEVSEEQKREDAYILRSYKSVEEVAQARERQLNQIQQEIAILEANLAEFQRRADGLREKAANYQASGEEPPASILKVLGDLEDQQEGVMEQIAERKKQYRNAEVRFERYARRLQALTGDDEGQDAEDSEQSGDSPQ